MKNTFKKKMEEACRKVNVKRLHDRLEERIYGQGKNLLTVAVHLNNFLKAAKEGKPVNTNLLITAPSGCGKTETYRAVNEIMMQYEIPVSVVQLDATDFTENGMRGKGTDDIARRIAESMVHKENNGYAIVFIDEIDKVTTKMDNDNRREKVQAQLLTLIEGRMFNVAMDNPERNFWYNSSNTMFIFTGAYQSLRELIVEIGKNKHIGFVNSEEDFGDESLYDELTIDDLIINGMLPEFAGRITSVINYTRLSDEDMKAVIEKQKKEIEKEMECTITLSEKTVNELLEMSNGSQGVRKCTREIKNRVVDAIGAYYDTEADDTEEEGLVEVRFDSLDEFKAVKIQKKQYLSKEE